MSKAEALKLVSDIARGNLGDYLTPQIVKKRTLVTKALSTLIEELQKEIEFEIEFEALLPEKEKTKQKVLIQAEKRQLLRMQLELKHNPKAKRIVEGPEELVEEMQLNINQVVADKVRGRIKAVTPSEHGVKVELYSAEAAQATILKIHGAFEKDNAQKKVEIPAPFSEEQVDKLISQLRKK